MPDLERFELARAPSDTVRDLLSSKDPGVRTRAALAAGRIGDSGAVAALERLLPDPEAGETAAWALGRIDGGQAALGRCIEIRCPSLRAAVRDCRDPAVLLRALQGPAAREAGFALGVLARGTAPLPDGTAAALAAAASRPDALSGAIYGLSRVPRAPGVREAIELGLHSPDPWTRSLAARAVGRHGLPADLLPRGDPDWRVRVEAARALSGAAAAKVDFAGMERESPHVVAALLESAATLGVLAPAPSSFRGPVLRCLAAQSRDRVRKRIEETKVHCGSDWQGRARAGALAAELGLADEARQAFADADGRVRAAAAGAAGAALADDLRRLLADPDPYVVQDAAGSLAKLDKDASRDAALQAARRLADAHMKPAGDPRSDALTALAPLTGPLPELLPTPNAALASALGVRAVATPLPPESLRGARVLRIRTSRGDLIADFHTDLAPITSGAIAALAARGFYDALDFHRVVPDFVVQGGDPRGDGDGGPGWAIPDEHSPLPFLRGTMGIATNGPETGGSQFFFCHSPQPHLDGHYTVAGQLRPESLPVLDALQPDDPIFSASAE
jgi:cyclophilin family peptidyl-prolyl cis-trans isomerase